MCATGFELSLLGGKPFLQGGVHAPLPTCTGRPKSGRNVTIDSDGGLFLRRAHAFGATDPRVPDVFSPLMLNARNH